MSIQAALPGNKKTLCRGKRMGQIQKEFAKL
jgi:hypothetical protein